MPSTLNPFQHIYRRSHGLRRFVRRRKDATAYQLARLALWLPRTVSLPRAFAMADRLGELLYSTLPETRRLAHEHLAIAYGDTLSATARDDIARASFRNVARCFVELSKFDIIRPQFDDYATIEGEENWDEVFNLGRGAIVITGHIGNWELLGAYFARRGVPIAAIAREHNDSRLNRLLIEFRASNGMRTILRESAMSSREILRILNQRGILALVIDQDFEVPSVSVPFFGRPARTPIAAAALALRRNIPVVPAYARRRPGGGQIFTICPPIYPPRGGDRRQDIVEMTNKFSQSLEDRIRLNPAEWVWWHRRWRRTPVPRLDLDSEIQYSNPVLS